MRFLILNTDYAEFLNWLYARTPGLEKQTHAEQLRARRESLFGFADFYSGNLRKLGHEAWDIYINNEPMQKAWALEHDIRPKKTSAEWRFRLRRNIIPWIGRVPNRGWLYDILEAQIKHYRPDILLNQSMSRIDNSFLKSMRPYVKLIVGQNASPHIGEQKSWAVYDLAVSSFPPTLEWFRKRGIPCELNRLGFEPRVLDRLQRQEQTVPVSFVGSFADMHKPRTHLLEHLSARVPLSIWGRPPDSGFEKPSLARCYRGTAWGIEMYNILAGSRITVNHHGDVPPYANNLRLFEATGVGTLLVTDHRQNLPEMFEPGREVAVYRSAEECAELIEYYLKHDAEREAIARAGQERTLREHTYAHRVRQLEDIIRRHLSL